MKRFFIDLTRIIILTVFSSSVFSHAGSHENQNCFITMDNNTLRFSGYQFQGQHPEHSYCLIFPELGQTVIKIEPVNDELITQKMALHLLKLDSWLGWMSHSAAAFFEVEKTPLQSFNHGVMMLNSNLQQRGVYALKIELQSNDKNKNLLTKNYLFLVGIPVTKILVIFSLLIFMAIIGLFINFCLKQNIEK